MRFQRSKLIHISAALTAVLIHGTLLFPITVQDQEEPKWVEVTTLTDDFNLPENPADTSTPTENEIREDDKKDREEKIEPSTAEEPKVAPLNPSPVPEPEQPKPEPEIEPEATIPPPEPKSSEPPQDLKKPEKKIFTNPRQLEDQDTRFDVREKSVSELSQEERELLTEDLSESQLPAGEISPEVSAEDIQEEDGRTEEEPSEVRDFPEDLLARSLMPDSAETTPPTAMEEIRTEQPESEKPLDKNRELAALSPGESASSDQDMSLIEPVPSSEAKDLGNLSSGNDEILTSENGTDTVPEFNDSSSQSDGVNLFIRNQDGTGEDQSGNVNQPVHGHRDPLLGGLTSISQEDSPANENYVKPEDYVPPGLEKTFRNGEPEKSNHDKVRFSLSDYGWSFEHYAEQWASEIVKWWRPPADYVTGQVPRGGSVWISIRMSKDGEFIDYVMNDSGVTTEMENRALQALISSFSRPVLPDSFKGEEIIFNWQLIYPEITQFSPEKRGR